jgi:hypothetical protein
VTILRSKLLFLIALTVVIVLALQGAFQLAFFTEHLGNSWWDGA